MRGFMSLRHVALVAGGLVLAGCTPPPVRYANLQDASEARFMRDRFACAEAASGRTVTAAGHAVTGSASAGMSGRAEMNDNLFSACLAPRGYIENRNGPLIVSGPALIETRPFKYH